MTAARMRLRRRQLLALPALGLGPLAAAPVRAQTPPAAVTLARPALPPGLALRLESTERDPGWLAEKHRQARQLLLQAAALQQALGELDGAWAETLAAVDALRGARLAWGAQAWPAWQAAQDELQQALASSDQAVATHQLALADVNSAAPGQRLPALARLDQTTTWRRHAEAGLTALADRLTTARSRAHGAAAAISTGLDQLATRLDSLARRLTRAATAWGEFAQGWAALKAGLGALPPAAGWAADLLPPAQSPGTAAPWAPSPPRPTWPETPLARQWHQPLADADAITLPLHAAHREASDAAATVRLLLADPGCRTDDCGRWLAEQGEIQRELDGLLAAQTRHRQALLAAASATADWTRSVDEQLALRLARQQGLAPALAGATGPAQARLRASSAALGRAAAELDRQHQRAEARMTELLLQRPRDGQPPPMMPGVVSPPSAVTSGGSAPTSVPAPAPVSRVQVVQHHALHTMLTVGDEPAGFIAYTYVLVGTTAARDNQALQDRLRQLVAALAPLTLAGQVEETEIGSTHTFVLPVMQRLADPQATPQFNLRLAQSLISKAPPALRLSDDFRRQLLRRDGPFLVSLPGPLARAAPHWPVLFADLSAEPEAVVVDVARRYMSDLLGSFTLANAEWRPPALMQVAITLVRLVQGTGEVAQAVFGPRLPR